MAHRGHAIVGMRSALLAPVDSAGVAVLVLVLALVLVLVPAVCAFAHLGRGHELGQVVGGEVAHADGAGLPRAQGVLQRACDTWLRVSARHVS